MTSAYYSFPVSKRKLKTHTMCYITVNHSMCFRKASYSFGFCIFKYLFNLSVITLFVRNRSLGSNKKDGYSGIH